MIDLMALQRMLTTNDEACAGHILCDVCRRLLRAVGSWIVSLLLVTNGLSGSDDTVDPSWWGVVIGCLFGAALAVWMTRSRQQA